MIREATILTVVEGRTFHRVILQTQASEHETTFTGETCSAQVAIYKLGASNALKCAGYKVEIKDVTL